MNLEKNNAFVIIVANVDLQFNSSIYPLFKIFFFKNIFKQ
jgi:hypothetical protein